MKKILSSSLLLAALAVAFTGCLKDKGFDNNTYGLNDPDTQPPGVGFPLGANARNNYGLNVSASTFALNDFLYVNLEAGTPAKSDVHVTLTDNTAALITAYLNSTTPPGVVGSIIPFPASRYNFPASLTIPAGGRNFQAPINILNTVGLDPNQAYAIGITISAVDGGYRIAENLKNLFMVFSVKNRLDGIYTITGAALRAGDPVLSGPFGPYNRAFATSGPNSVQWQGSVLWANGSGSSLPDGYQSNVTVDPGSNLVTSVTSPNGAVYSTAPGTVRTDIIPGGIQKYDPVTKTLYWEISYTTPANRLFTFVAVYSGPR